MRQPKIFSCSYLGLTGGNTFKDIHRKYAADHRNKSYGWVLSAAIKKNITNHFMSLFDGCNCNKLKEDTLS